MQQKKSLQGLGSLQTFAASSRKFGDEYHLSNVYQVCFQNDSFLVMLDEEAVYHSLYCAETVFEKIGQEMMIAMDVALAKGGTEAVVESFYSTMSSQSMPGGQSNDTLALRYQ